MSEGLTAKELKDLYEKKKAKEILNLKGLSKKQQKNTQEFLNNLKLEIDIKDDVRKNKEINQSELNFLMDKGLYHATVNQPIVFDVDVFCRVCNKQFSTKQISNRLLDVLCEKHRKEEVADKRAREEINRTQHDRKIEELLGEVYEPEEPDKEYRDIGE